jgi:hypothetical protein
MRSDDIAAALSEVLWTAERNRRPLQLPDLRVAVPDQAAAYAVQRCTFDQRRIGKITALFAEIEPRCR